MGFYRNFWPFTGIIAVFLDSLMLTAYHLGIDFQLTVVAVVSFTFIIAPLTAWLSILRIAGEDVFESL